MNAPLGSLGTSAEGRGDAAEWDQAVMIMMRLS
jgi:hypothetical protein